MMRKVSAVLAALAFTAVTIAPAAEARDRRGDGYHSGRHYRDYDRRYHNRYRGNDGDEAAAAVVGLVLGLAIGSLASQPSNPPQARCYDNYQRCAPPQRYDDRGYAPQGYDPRDDQGSAYEDEYGLEGGEGDYSAPPQQREQCMRRERQWDRYANRYLMVDVPC